VLHPAARRQNTVSPLPLLASQDSLPSIASAHCDSEIFFHENMDSSWPSSLDNSPSLAAVVAAKPIIAIETSPPDSDPAVTPLKRTNAFYVPAEDLCTQPQSEQSLDEYDLRSLNLSGSVECKSKASGTCDAVADVAACASRPHVHPSSRVTCILSSEWAHLQRSSS